MPRPGSCAQLDTVVHVDSLPLLLGMGKLMCTVFVEAVRLLEP